MDFEGVGDEELPQIGEDADSNQKHEILEAGRNELYEGDRSGDKGSHKEVVEEDPVGGLGRPELMNDEEGEAEQDPGEKGRQGPEGECGGSGFKEEAYADEADDKPPPEASWDFHFQPSPSDQRQPKRGGVEKQRSGDKGHVFQGEMTYY